MRKILSIVLALITVCCMSALVACGKHEHAYDASKWETDATSHWHVCTGEDCAEVGDKAEHSFVSKTDNDKHWQECSVCGFKKDEANHTLETKTSAEKHWQECACGVKQGEVEHTFVDKHNETQYWSECSECGYQQEKITATVDAATLANAIQFKDAEGNEYTNWQAENFDKVKNKVTIKVKYTGDGYYRYNEETTEALEGIYLNFDNDGVKTYAKYEKANADSEWVKTTGKNNYTTLGSTARNFVGISKSLSTCSFEDFSYSEEDNMYHIEVGAGESESRRQYYTYSIKFANGKLIGFSVVKNLLNKTTGNITIQSDVSWTIDYGNATIEVPEVND